MKAAIAASWEWLTKSRYTRRLEQENAQLREELRQWQDALLQSVNLPRITPPGPSQPVELKRRLMPSQFRRAAEKACMPPPPPKEPTKGAA